MIVLGNIAIVLITFIATVAVSNWFRPLGGLIYTASGLPLHFERTRHFFNRVFIEFLGISFLFKVIGFVVSASGVLALILTVQWFYPDILQTSAFFWGVFLASINITLKIMHDVHLMKPADIHDVVPMVQRVTKIDFSTLTEKDRMTLAGTYFADMSIINILIIVFNFGISSFCAYKLGLVSSEYDFTAVDSVLSSLSMLDIISEAPFHTSGVWATVLGIFYGTSVFIYIVFFIGLSSRLIDIKPEPTEAEVATEFAKILHSMRDNDEPDERSEKR